MSGTDTLDVLLVDDYCDIAGGAEEILHHEASLLQSAGHEVTSVGFRRAGEDRAQVTDHVLTESANRPRRIAEKILVQPSIYRGLRELVDTVDPDVIHLHKNVNYPATVLLACRDYPILKTHHDFTNLCPSGWAVYQDTHEVCPGGPGPKCVRHGCKSVPEMVGYHGPRHAIRFPLQRRLIGHHLAPSQVLVEYLNRFGFPARAVPNPRPATFAADPTFGPGDPYFVYAGTHAEKKGVQRLIDAVERAKVDRDRRLELRIAGDGPLRETLQRRTRELGLTDRIEFPGYVSDEELRDLVSNARAVVVPSLWMENFPTVISEAFSLGRPVIGSDRGGIPEMLDDGDRGLVYGATDLDALVAALLELQDDPQRAARLGREGYRYATDELDPERYRRRVVEAMRETIAA